MCLILDTNSAHHFASPISQDGLKVLDWVEQKGGCIIYGGQNADELFNAGTDMKRLLVTLTRAGRAKRMPDQQVKLETSIVLATGLFRSDDPHIIALARISNARVLYSHDTDLHEDFKNLNLLPSPKGTIYQNQTHARLLTHTSLCIGRPKA